MRLPLFSIYDPALPKEQFFSRAFGQAVVNHLAPAVPPFWVAFFLAAVLTPVAILVARRLGFMKLPRDRDIHRVATADVGGFALFAAFSIAAWESIGWSPLTPAVISLGAAALVVGAFDDRRPIPAWVKLGLQAAIVLVAVLAFPSNYFQIGYLTVPGVAHPVNLLPVIAIPLSVFWVLGMQNTVNFLDGVDGLAAGVVAIVALTLLVAASTKGPLSAVLLSASLAGACAGFLLFNFHPARVFMGDAGSNFLGLILGLLSIAGVAKVAVAFALLIPVMALAIPIADTVLAIVRRRRQGLSIAHPDTRHIHHQLLDFGLTQWETCLVFYCSAGILGALGLTLLGQHRRILSIAVVLLVVPLSTVLGELLQRGPWRVPVPGLRRLLWGPARPTA